MSTHFFRTPSLVLISLLVFFSCGEKETQVFESEAIAASGEFLFEGPNTLQGPFTLTLSQVSKQLGIEESAISDVRISGISLTFDDDANRQNVESVLVQVVSNDLSLETAGTLNPLGAEPVQELQINQELDFLPYLKDQTTQLIVDANLTTDMDMLGVGVVFKFIIVQ
ncbi:MAG: hypothetical protein JXR10_12345 [Cyclobacteriaceae bacterium]